VFISDEPTTKYYARDGSTLDPKKLNEAIRHAEKQIKYVQRHKYTYSQMNFDLIGINLKSISPEERRFIIRPPEDCEIIGAHITAANIPDGETVFARWMNPDDVTTYGAAAGKVVVIEATSTGGAGTATPNEEDVEMPSGTARKTFKYVEAKGQSGFDVCEGITTRPVNLLQDQNYVLEVGYSEDVASRNVTVDDFASLVLFVRSDRGSSDEWSVPELLDGSDVTYASAGTAVGTTDTPGIQNIVNELSTQVSNSLDSSEADTIRCDVIKCSNLGASQISAGALNMLLSSRIPRFPTLLDNGRIPADFDVFKTNCKWSLYRVDFVLVSSASTFSPAAGDVYDIATRIESQSGIAPPAAGNNFYTIADPRIGENGLYEYKEVYVRGPTASSGSGLESRIDSETLVGGTTQVSPLDPDHDLKFNTLANVAGGAQNVQLAYMYIWYRLTT